MNFISNRPIILASGSPRRQELLQLVGIPFEVIPSNVDEDVELVDGDFDDYVQKLALKKASAVSESVDDALVIAADTIVVFDGEVYPKPSSVEQAECFLTRFSGKTHSVFTGVCIQTNTKSLLFSEETKVTFNNLDETLVKAYVQSGDSKDKAGGYGIQTAGALLVKEIEGDYLNVVGLPLSKIVERLREEGHLTLKEGERFLDT